MCDDQSLLWVPVGGQEQSALLEEGLALEARGSRLFLGQNCTQHLCQLWDGIGEGY